jgi:intracellular septation protein A
MSNCAETDSLILTGQRNNDWRAYLMCGTTTATLCFTIWVAIWMWQKMSNKGGLGEEESKAFQEVKKRMENSK